MKKNTLLFDETEMRFIQKVIHVSREEVIETIRISSVSAEEIARYLREKGPGIKSPLHRLTIFKIYI